MDLRCSVRIERIVSTNHVTGILLGDGTTVNCDAVVVGIGVTPRIALARASGLEIDNGIAVDETLRTSDPGIFAAGDVCSFIHPLFGRRMRLESWKNAEDQAKPRQLWLPLWQHGSTHNPTPNRRPCYRHRRPLLFERRQCAGFPIR